MDIDSGIMIDPFSSGECECVCVCAAAAAPRECVEDKETCRSTQLMVRAQCTSAVLCVCVWDFVSLCC